MMHKAAGTENPNNLAITFDQLLTGAVKPEEGNVTHEEWK